LQLGDRLVAVNGLAVHHDLDWNVVGTNFESNRPQRFEIERAGRRLEVEVTLGPRNRAWAHMYLENRVLLIWYPFVQIAMFGLSLFISFSRPYDSVARVGGALLAATGVVFALANPPYGMAVTVRHLPVLVGELLWIPVLAGAATFALLFTFCAIFPRRLLRTLWIWIAWSVFALVSVPAAIHSHYLIRHPSRAIGLLPSWYLPVILALYIAYLLAALAVLVLNYHRLTDANERRRLRVLVAGTVTGWLALVPPKASYFLGDKFVPAFFSSLPVLLLAGTLFLAFPLSFAYAILRHRLFDIRVMIRQGLRYALARRVIVWAVPAAIALLVGDLIAKFMLLGTSGGAGNISDGTEILKRNLWVDAFVGVGIVLVYKQHQRWLDALDRRFFRERYDANRVLREVAEQLLRAARFEEAAPMVVARIESALHPEFAALLVREARQPNYRILASAPAGQAPPPLPADSKLVSLVRLLGKPLEVRHTESGWLQKQLPHEEMDFLRCARIELFVPVTTGVEFAEAILALGSKRSEEPYSREDMDLLAAIAASLALLLERPASPAPRVSAAFEECPQCGACYDTGARHCARDAATLASIPLPRLLSSRYFLERRLGKGGMGVVYEATDRALERRVAAKVIRDDLMGSAEAAERFRREARAAASFSHPNVVTVFDFGVAAGIRAFLVMELLEGASLREVLRRQGRLPPDRALEILRGVCAAVDAAHRRQLIHRDLKPENVFLARQETGEMAKVLDFGVAKFLPSDTQTTVDTGTGGGFLVGTLRYMSPEQLRGEAAAASWDLWALAAVTYEVLTGQHPFEQAKPGELSRAILSGCFSPVSCHLPDAPPSWQNFFSRAFALDPFRRPTSADALFAELRTALA
jgi:eukaryotic-like serine/threonine-protein kinase